MEKQQRKGRPKSAKARKTVSLTIEPEAWELLEEKAKAMGLRRSDLVEMLAMEGKRPEALGESSAS